MQLTFNDGIYRTALLAESTVDALGHINIISGSSSTSINTFFSFDGDGLRRTNGLTELASNASFFSRGISAESVLATEAGGDRTFLEWVEDCVSISMVSLPIRMHFQLP